MRLSRRQLLHAGACGLSAFLLPAGLARRAAGSAATRTLVVVYLRGGADGLQLVPPHGDPLYYANRPTIGVPAQLLFDLDGFFGLHPALAPLESLFRDGDLAVVHACGSPDPTRSHFDAQDYMERGAPGDPGVSTGWINRSLFAQGGRDAIQGITLQPAKVKAMLGPAPTLAFGSVAGFRLRGLRVGERGEALGDRYALLPGELGESVVEAFQAIGTIASVPTDTSVAYPASPVAARLRDAAAIVKADVGARVIALDSGSWDHHSDLGPRLDVVASDLAASLAAFYQDLGPRRATTLTLCMTEFGRRVAENAALGTEHGHGGIMLALGGGIAGGRVVLRDAAWPGLGPDELHRGEDLAVTTDFRDVLAEALDRHLGFGLQTGLFPDFTVDPARYPGLFG